MRHARKQIPWYGTSTLSLKGVSLYTLSTFTHKPCLLPCHVKQNDETQNDKTKILGGVLFRRRRSNRIQTIAYDARRVNSIHAIRSCFDAPNSTRGVWVIPRNCYFYDDGHPAHPVRFLFFPSERYTLCEAQGKNPNENIKHTKNIPGTCTSRIPQYK